MFHLFFQAGEKTLTFSLFGLFIAGSFVIVSFVFFFHFTLYFIESFADLFFDIFDHFTGIFFQIFQSIPNFVSDDCGYCTQAITDIRQ